MGEIVIRIWDDRQRRMRVAPQPRTIPAHISVEFSLRVIPLRDDDRHANAALFKRLKTAMALAMQRRPGRARQAPAQPR